IGPSTMPTTSGIQEQVTREELFNEAVNLLYICDFPPSNFAGGQILMSRLLRDYPPDRIVVLTSSRYLSVSPKEGRLLRTELSIPAVTVPSRPRGLPTITTASPTTKASELPRSRTERLKPAILTIARSRRSSVARTEMESKMSPVAV